jgi:hypothetical protein
MKVLSFLSRYRLLVNVLALALALGALAASPTPALANPAMVCDEGCVDWDTHGCNKMMSCCVESPTDWTCVEW